MSKRLISSGIGTAIGITVLWLDNKWLFLAAFAAISVAAVYEILVATKYVKNIAVAVISLLFAATVPFLLNWGHIYQIRYINVRYVSFAFVVGLFIIMLFSHKKVQFSQVALVAFISLCIPFSLSCAVFMFDRFGEGHRTFALVYALTITWISDSGAYFAGTFFGKHKMAPNISPKKTWEGFAGGLLSAALFGFLLGRGYELTTRIFTGELNFEVQVLFLTALAIPCSLLGVLGDFSASILKRECSVKDFGSIMPGHGGVLDRFDSILFVMPFVYFVFEWQFPVVPII